MSILQMIEAVASLIGSSLTLFVGIFGSYYLIRSGIGEKTNSLQQSTILAIQARMNTQEQDINDLRRDNARLQQTIETICHALKIRGIIISIQGEMINIEDKNGISSTVHIRESNGDK